MDKPRTLVEAIRFFADPDNCHHFMVERRWPTGEITCPTCGGGHLRFDRKRYIWHCNNKHPRRQFSIKVGTIFEDSPLSLDKWLPTVWMVANMKNGVSSHELARSLGITQKSAWFMLHRVRLAMQERQGTFAGEVEADETFVGGRARFMHADRRERVFKGRQSGHFGKVAVMGILERNSPDQPSRVVTQVVPNVRRPKLQLEIRKHVRLDGKTTLFTDALKSYEPKTPKDWRPSELYIHKVIDHAETYVNGNVHTNGMENYWSLLKRMIRGTYVSVEPFHLFRYLDEEAFRFNHRKDGNDSDRFMRVLDSVMSRRLTYKELIGEGKKPSNN